MPFGDVRDMVPGWWDVVEILLVAWLLYRLLLFLAGTRALQILLGTLILVVVYIGAGYLHFNMITTLLGLIFTYGAFAALVAAAKSLCNGRFISSSSS